MHIQRGLLASPSFTWLPSFTELKEHHTIWELKPVCWLTGAGVTTARYTHAREVLLKHSLKHSRVTWSVATRARGAGPKILFSAVLQEPPCLTSTSGSAWVGLWWVWRRDGQSLTPCFSDHVYGFRSKLKPGTFLGFQTTLELRGKYSINCL